MRLQILLFAIIGFYGVYSQPNTESSSSVISTQSNFNATFACTIVQNGTVLKDPTSCNTWIQCINQKPISGSCPNGLFFNRNTNKCVDPDTIKCLSSEPCASVTTKNGTFLADPYSCSSYYYCLNGVATLGACSSGLNYNPETDVCIQNFTCPQNLDPDNWCNIIPDGQFFSNLQRCRKYHFCQNGILENGTCPTGYYFNAFKSICDYEKNVYCPLAELRKFKKSGQGICQNDGQFLSDNTTCSGYFYCQLEESGEFQMIWQNCSNGRFFDPLDGGKCGYRSDVECKYDRCVGMGLNGIQLVNGQSDSCRGYLICQDGKQIGNGTCPDDKKYFDEDLQRCTSDVVQFPACSTNSTAV
ncbi:peritrophin-48 [Episyrphus balteatus]|uniref:peritrophin-48 n=1 Tax=Episyrphus balteatus TaxID=286459 RepID=UPI002484FE1E|nr:peritrophin-48 [Episyrphus balteatus]